MKITILLKCIFIPWYLFNLQLKKKSDNSPGGLMWGFVLTFYIFLRLSAGISDANKPDKCRLQSIGDIIIAPMYTLGCNIGKDRFDIKVN